MTREPLREPTFTDVHQLRRQEEEYHWYFHKMQKWRVKPRDAGYGDNAVDSTFCYIFTDRSEEFGDHSKDVQIADSMRGAWAMHIVQIHNEWLTKQS